MSDSAEITHIDEGVFGSGALGRPHGAVAQAIVVVAVLVSWVICGFAARWLGLPELVHYDGSLLMGESPVSAVIIAAVLLLVCTLIGTVIAGCVRFEAGLFAACVGLMALSLRGGTSQSVLFEGNGSPHVYMVLTIELAILGGIIALAWGMLWTIGRAGMTRPMPEHLALEPASAEGPVAGVTSLIAHVVAMGLLVIFLCQSQAKYQALASVFVASAAGAMIAYGISPARPSAWFWSGSLIVGLIGFILAASGQDTNLAVGMPQGFFAPLARPLPLDYASLGTAGAILGYWTMRNRRN
jgi:hypothetical protein